MSDRKVIHSPGTKDFYTDIGACEAVVMGDVVYVSGQVGWDEALKPAATFEAQVRQTFANMANALEQAGCTLDDIIDLRMYVVQQPGIPLMQMIETAFKIKKALAPRNVCAATGLAVSALALPELMIECAAVAHRRGARLAAV